MPAVKKVKASSQGKHQQTRGRSPAPQPVRSAASSSRIGQASNITPSSSNPGRGGTMSRIAKWFDGSNDEPPPTEENPQGGVASSSSAATGQTGPTNPTARSSTSTEGSGAAGGSFQPPPPSAPVLPQPQFSNPHADFESAPQASTSAQAVAEDPDAITPAPPLTANPTNAEQARVSTVGPTLDPAPTSTYQGRTFHAVNSPLAIPINMADQPGPGAHEHVMTFDKCKHDSESYVECEETDPAACKYNSELTLRGVCPSCSGSKGVRNSIRRFGSWITRTASRITNRERPPIGGAFDQAGGAGGTSGASDNTRTNVGGSGGGDGQGSNRPLSGHRLRAAERERRRNARGQTGSSVGAGGFDPTIQDDTESNKS
ncbi:hypothetical protein H072_7072 [Dactylellina haptotyla CBS 200.50]|uniref:Uncharacterized protein n=1 Tax=Dactylellina haptotyla (strain CBS 200.50) TaxID=1284197 RepID=S8A8D8_DACHA|nr:hypothetical protein H072_7072 [Dactylellina haptotyla CBS 200.50]